MVPQSIGLLFSTILGTGIVVLLFLAFRVIVLWYWKIDRIVQLLERQVKLLEQQNQLFRGKINTQSEPNKSTIVNKEEW